ncbi:hypothetical protein AVEN_241970-1 [Araneus ventricosus]|uniref:Uncharacterized protein n=1 Tax=Araneus ventricosus TaxID=182803 RepID=A0A4Y2WZW8_ARAVE|nr:hypothetical protein AVEN_241970-1 [Araneus ventricosus]
MIHRDRFLMHKTYIHIRHSSESGLEPVMAASKAETSPQGNSDFSTRGTRTSPPREHGHLHQGNTDSPPGKLGLLHQGNSDFSTRGMCTNGT